MLTRLQTAQTLFLNFAANLSEIYEQLQAESHIARTVLLLVGDCNLISETCSKPLSLV